MKNIVFTSVMMVACYIMYCYGIVYCVPPKNMVLGAFALMVVSWTAGSTFSTERFKDMLDDLLNEIARERNEN